MNGRAALTLGAHATLLVTSLGGSYVIIPINSFDRHGNTSSFTDESTKFLMQINEPQKMTFFLLQTADSWQDHLTSKQNT